MRRAKRREARRSEPCDEGCAKTGGAEISLTCVWANTGWTENILFTPLFTPPPPLFTRVCVPSDTHVVTGVTVNPLKDMMASKFCELICESMPGLIVQLVALLRSPTLSKRALASAAISAGSAAMVSAVISYDWDVDVGVRKQNPQMNGIIPDTGRGVAFAAMFALSLLQLSAKGLSAALLFVTSVRWLVLYQCAVVGAFFLYKIARRDFLLYLPDTGVIAAVVGRLTEILSAELVGLMGQRFPLQLGGMYFTFTLIQVQVGALVSVHLYNKYAEGGDAKLSPALTWGVAISIAAAWAITYLFFVLHVVTRSHRHMFYSTETGVQAAENIFLAYDSDERKIYIFNRNRRKWRRIEPQVMGFMKENWSRWEAEKPAWFSGSLISSVPDEFIPQVALAKLGKARKRRGSARVTPVVES